MSDTPRTDAATVDEDARWLEVLRLSNQVAYSDNAPTAIESALCSAVVRAKEAMHDLSAAQAEIGRLREDAERYRTQRDIAHQGLLESCPDECVPVSEADFNATYDAAIDQARKP